MSTAENNLMDASHCAAENLSRTQDVLSGDCSMAIHTFGPVGRTLSQASLISQNERRSELDILRRLDRDGQQWGAAVREGNNALASMKWPGCMI